MNSGDSIWPASSRRFSSPPRRRDRALFELGPVEGRKTLDELQSGQIDKPDVDMLGVQRVAAVLDDRQLSPREERQAVEAGVVDVALESRCRRPVSAEELRCSRTCRPPKPPRSEPAAVVAFVSPVSVNTNDRNRVPGLEHPVLRALERRAAGALGRGIGVEGRDPVLGRSWIVHPLRVEHVAVCVQVARVRRGDVGVDLAGMEDDRLAGPKGGGLQDLKPAAVGQVGAVVGDQPVHERVRLAGIGGAGCPADVLDYPQVAVRVRLDALVAAAPERARLPLLIAVIVFTVLTTWQRGRQLVTARRARLEGPLRAFVDELHERTPPVLRAPGCAVCLNRGKETAPLAMRASVDRLWLTSITPR